MRMMYFSVSDTGKLGKRNSECSYQESNLPITSSDALATTELHVQETCGS